LGRTCRIDKRIEPKSKVHQGVNQMKTRRNLPIILLLTMILSIFPLGSFAQANGVSPFSDVGNAHWGLQHIIKMELRGVITGYGGGEFRPDNKVSQLEAVIMAIRAMGLKEEATTVDTTPIENWGLDLPNGWNAEGYVALAVKHNLIDTDNFNPNGEASRAWVAQLVIRMMNAQDEVQENITTSFTDDQSIPSWAKSYVALAVEKAIITGIAESSGSFRFDPLSSVTRAQLATMISRADPYMGEVKGQLSTATISLVAGQQVNLTNKDDKTDTFFMDSSVVIYNAKGDRITSNQLRESDLIRYGTNKNGSIIYMEVLDPSLYEIEDKADKSLVGIIVQHFKEDNLLTVRNESGALTTIKYADGVRVTLKSSTISVDSLDVGDEVTVNQATDNTVLSIQVKNKSVESITMGKIYSINLETNILTLEKSGAYSSYALSASVAVEYEGVRFPTVKDLRKGDQVELLVEDQEVKTIRLLVPYQSETLSGKIVNVAESTDIITVRLSDGALKAYEVSKTASITITGVSNPSVSDLKADDNITFSVENNVVTSLTVTNREVMNEIKGKVVSVDTRNMFITIQDDSNQYKTFEINEFVKLDLGVRSPILADISIGMIVTLKLDKNIIYEITLNNTVEGKLVRVEQNQSLITLDTSQGRVNYRLDTTVDVNIIDVSRPDLDDLEVGQHILLTLQQEYVTDIDVKVDKLGTLTEVDTRSKDITVKFDKNEKEYDVLSSTVIVVPTITKPTISNLKEGDSVRLKFLGDKLTNIDVVPPVYGTIKEIDSYRNKMVLQTLDGAKDYSLTNVTVYNETNSKMSLSNLAKDDYVKVVTLENEVIITRTKAINGKFVTLSSTRDKIYITESNGLYKNYLLSVDVRLWKGTAIYYLGDLKQNQDVTLYMLGDKVIGISVK
jgi:hypothetical protein